VVSLQEADCVGDEAFEIVAVDTASKAGFGYLKC
jgi:hypothetical protein